MEHAQSIKKKGLELYTSMGEIPAIPHDHEDKREANPQHWN
jgi:mannitol/fructose-specific phosphotransferase system IIA component